MMPGLGRRASVSGDPCIAVPRPIEIEQQNDQRRTMDGSQNIERKEAGDEFARV